MIKSTPSGSMLDNVVGFSRALHRAGVEVNSGNLIDLCNCIGHIDVQKRPDFYAAARATLVSRFDDLETFDYVFNTFWGVQIETLEMDVPQEVDDADLMDMLEEGGEDPDSAEQEEDAAEGEGDSDEPGWSPDEMLLKKDLAAMSDKEIEQARKVIAEIVNIIANRRSRRRIPENQGPEIDFRRTWRKNAAMGPDGVELAKRRKRIKKTKLMVLCDVSGSMDCYSRFLIQFSLKPGLVKARLRW